MKMLRILAAAAGVLCAVSLQAQGGRPEGPQMPEPMSDSLWAATRTQEMVEKYTLTPEQEQAVFELNVKYADKMNFSGRMPGQGERRDFRSMSEEERQKFFEEMMSRREEMEQKMQERREARKAYEEELEGLLNKDQLKAYRKDRRREEGELQKRMQRGMGGGRPGGFPGGGPGGFPGGGPGGFPGGGPGGFGGF